MLRISFVFILFFISVFAYASPIEKVKLPLGRWLMSDDNTGKPKAWIRIYEANGRIEGKIEKLLQEGAEIANPKCEKCDGALKNQAFLGLVILSGFAPSGPDKWHGRILDPENGKTYDAIVTAINGGEQLDVHGYIGIQLFGRRQIWKREP